MYLVTDPYEVAQHKLRHLHDQPSLLPPLPLGEACPALDAGGRGEGPLNAEVAPAKAGARPEEDEPPDEGDDPL